MALISQKLTTSRDENLEMLRKLCGAKKEETPESTYREWLEEEQKEEEEDYEVDDTIVEAVSLYGYPEDYVRKCLAMNVCNYCTTAYYLLGTDQNYIYIPDNSSNY